MVNIYNILTLAVCSTFLFGSLIKFPAHFSYCYILKRKSAYLACMRPNKISMTDILFQEASFI